MELNGLTHNLCYNLNTFESAQIYLSLPRKLPNLMLFYSGRDHTIIIAKESSCLDVEIRSKHNQFIMAGRGN